MSVFEDYGWTDGRVYTYADGAADAAFALNQAVAAGAPKATVGIPFAVDTGDYQGWQTDAYADGLASVLTKERCGVYGAAWMVRALGVPRVQGELGDLCLVVGGRRRTHISVL